MIIQRVKVVFSFLKMLLLFLTLHQLIEHPVRVINLRHDSLLSFFISSHGHLYRESYTSAKSPNLNAYAERFVLSIRRECLDGIVPLNDSCVNSDVEPK